MRTRRTLCAASSLAFCLVACGGRELAVDSTVGPVELASVTDHVVAIDHGRSEAFLLDVSGPGAPPHPSVVPLPTNVVRVIPRKSHPDELLVLSTGHPDDGTAPADQPGLTIVDASGKNRYFRYDAAFDTLEQSEDGKTALLHFSSGDAGGDSLFNPNQYAVIDLEGKQSPTQSSFRNLGGTVSRVVFSPPGFSLESGEKRNLAAVLFDSYLSILDLDHLDRPEYSVPLSEKTSANLGLAQVLFSEKEPKLFARAANTNDVFVVTLSTATPTGSGNDFKPYATQLAAGTNPSDIALYGEGPSARLLVAAPGSQEIVVVDSNTSNVTNVPVGQSAENILLFNGTSPVDSEKKERALLYSTGQSSVVFVDLENLEDRGASNVESLALAEPYSDPIQLDEDSVMFPHQTTGLSIVKLSDRTVTQISGPNLKGAVPDDAVGKLWLKHGSRVGFLDLTGFLPNEVRVDAPIVDLVTVAGKLPKVAVSHASSTGYVTVLDAENPTDLGSAYALRGFLFDSVLSGGGR